MSLNPRNHAAKYRFSSWILGITIIAGMVGVIMLARWFDNNRPKVASRVEQERLYLTGNAVRRVSLSFNGLVADWYWMRALQYVGRKILDAPENFQLDELSQLDLRLLAPLLDAATTLDPQFMEPYQFAAVVLPSIDPEEAIRITKKGIAANPKQWRLYQHLGYIYWQRGDYSTAAEAYGQGAAIPGAPPWMEGMKARMSAEGGSRDVAREIYSRMYEQAGDLQVKETARLRLLQLESFDQRDVIRKLLAMFKARTGRCPTSWNELAPLLRAVRLPVTADGVPLDPANTPYVLVSEKCDVDLDPRSDVPYK
jgi:tetratricopeptide (TPR) repeat protein